MFNGAGPGRTEALTDSALMRLAKQNEDRFLQMTMLNKHYRINCSRLTLWEYMLLIEQIDKEANELKK